MSKAKRKRETSRSTSVDVLVAAPNANVTLTSEPACEAACPSNWQHTVAHEEAIRMLAHSKWEAAGCPAGDGFDFWLAAEREVLVQRSEPCAAQG